MDLHQGVRDLLQEIGPGRMTSTAYDTAWIARLGALDGPMGERALEWLRVHQLADGSWGASEPRYCHDRAICTLAAMTALARQGRAQDRTRCQRAQRALEAVTKRLAADPAGETIGFEMIAPTLLAEAEGLGVVLRQNGRFLRRLAGQRAAKLASLPRGMVSRFVTAAFSAEMAGPDGLQLLDVENLQEANGSVGHSPSATAYFALHVRCQDTAALRFLSDVAANGDGGVPDAVPFDLFERAWTLWNLALTGPLDGGTRALCEPHLDFLGAAWRSGQGVGFAAGYTPEDGDGTSVAHEVLTRFARSVDLEAVLRFEGDHHFRCYALEANPSVSTNVHVLSALRQAGLGVGHPSVQKVLRFLQRTRPLRLGPFWVDKWHASPYYPTAHAVTACAGYADALVGDAISWILATQNADGSWGYYAPTAEETAYCLQALVVWRRHGGPVADDVLRQGAAWLAEHAEPPYPPLWIGKCLYCPVLVVRSAVLSALMLVAQEGD